MYDSDMESKELIEKKKLQKQNPEMFKTLYGEIK